MAIEAGQTLLQYRLVEKLGEGGMGVVWKAVDTSLDREVAIKILPDAFAADAERLARFDREAKLLASLNHPNIASIYGLHEAAGVRFLAMELIEGEDLAARLGRGRLSIEDALGIAQQVGEALEAAHDNGVIHRDLKPANIQITPDGKIKVLDFGLAKAFEPAAISGPSSLSLSPTLTSAGTQAGVILGTAAYMSPEQARGKPADRRSDIWSFGCVLFEMLSGRRAFDGETVSDVLAAVLKSEPDWNALPPDTPALVRTMLRRCLTKNPASRLPHIAGVRLDLSESMSLPAQAFAEPTETSTRSGWSAVLPWVLVVVLAAFATVLLWQRADAPTGVTDVIKLSIPFSGDMGVPMNQQGVIALSPDGRNLAIALGDEEGTRLFIKRMDRMELEEISGTNGASSPVFSPDGQWIAFLADKKVKKVLVQGGKPVTLCNAPGNDRGATWTDSGQIIFARHYTESLMQVPAAGGEPTPLTSLDDTKHERTHRWPFAIPGTDIVLFTVGALESPESYDDSRIDAIDLGTGQRKTIYDGASLATYLSTGHLIVAREGFLFAVPFDLDRLEVTGAPVPVVENVLGMRASGVVFASFSNNGMLAFVPGSLRTLRHAMRWRNFDGTTEDIPAPLQNYSQPRLSPDGDRVALGVRGDLNYDVWTYDLERGTLTRLTFEGDNTGPVWSPDGKSIAFSSIREGSSASIYVKPADGSGEAQLVYAGDRRPKSGGTTPQSWSPDGRRLATQFANHNAANISVLSLEEDEEVVVVDTPAAEVMPDFSPDGNWIAYAANETGRSEVYVRPFPGPGGRWQISSDGGSEPYFSSDGRSIFFRDGGELLVVDIDTRDGFKVGRPRVVLEDLQSYGPYRSYSLAPDGKRVLSIERIDDDDAAPEGVTVVVNWLDELRSKVAAP